MGGGMFKEFKEMQFGYNSKEVSSFRQLQLRKDFVPYFYLELYFKVLRMTYLLTLNN